MLHRVGHIRLRTVLPLALVLTGLFVGCSKLTSSRPLVDYRRSGGFVGLDDHLVIGSNGEVTLTRKTGRYEFVLDRDTANRMVAAFDGAQFSKLRRKYSPTRQASDLLTYEITYKGRTVRAVDTAVPESLWPVLESLNHIIDTYERP